MMARLKQDRDIDYVIVYNRSRMHRDSVDAAITKRDLRSAGVNLVSVMDYTEDSYIGDLVATIIDGVNEYQSRAQGADISRKMAGKAERGGTPGRAKLGYLNIREQVDGREVRTVAKDPERAAFIVMLFGLYATGKHSFPDLREAVTRAGLRTRPNNSHPAGTTISINQIGQILRDRYYLGCVTHKGRQYKGRHDPLISQDLIDQVQHVLYAERGAGTRNRVYNHNLKGLLHCHRCRRQLMLDRSKNSRGDLYFYFLCSGRRDHQCQLPRLPVAMIDRVIEDHCATVRIPDDVAQQLHRALKEAISQHATTTGTLRKQLHAERKRLITQQDQCIELLGDPDWPRDRLTQKMRQLQADIAAVDNRLRAYPTQDLERAATSLQRVVALLNDPRELYRRLDDNQRKLFLKSCFTHIDIDVDDAAQQPWVPGGELRKPLTPLHPAARQHNAPCLTAGRIHSNTIRHILDQCADKQKFVEPQGIEPWSFAASVRLLRVQFAVPFLKPHRSRELGGVTGSSHR